MTVRPSPPPPNIYQKLDKAIVAWIIGIANRRAVAQVNSTAATVADLRTDFNLLLTNLRAKGLMEE